MKAIIPIGGRGTRMRPVTFSSNKHFIPVANRLLIEYPIQSVVDAGVTDIAITYNPGQLEYAKKILGDGSRWNVSFTYILQQEPKGLANIVEVCEDWVAGDSFLLHLGDNIFTGGIKRLIEYFEEKKPQGLLPMLQHEENHRLGVPYFDEQGVLKEYIEKPKNPPHKFAVPGLYIADNVAFEAFKGKDRIKASARGEYEIPSVFQWLIDHGHRVEVKEYTEGEWLDPGKFDDWLDSNRYLLDTQATTEIQSEIEGSKIEGRVEIGKNSKIIHSTVRGPVRIGDDVEIVDSFVGPYTSVYHKCHINKCHVENSVLMEGVKLDNVSKIIDSSLIGPDSEIIATEDAGNKMQLFLGELNQIHI